jgi:uncharacterized protein
MKPDLLLVFTGGLLSSAHCVGMCGAFALSIGASSPAWRTNLIRQLTYSFGRIVTYTCAGAMAGYAGLRLNSTFSAAVPIQSFLAIIAGGLLIAQGLFATGIVRRKIAAGQHPCLLPRFLHAFLLAPGLNNVFFAGVFTGFLPCGLVYAFLALASATTSMPSGWLTMLAFGMGTMPIMIATGLGSGLLTVAARRRVFQVAGLCVLLAGAVSMARGVAFLESAADAQSNSSRTSFPSAGDNAGLPRCPCCRD